MLCRELKVEGVFFGFGEVKSLVLVLAARPFIEPFALHSHTSLCWNKQTSRNFLDFPVERVVGEEVCNCNFILSVCVLGDTGDQIMRLIPFNNREFHLGGDPVKGKMVLLPGA
ncbi:hypothetical protein D9M68_728070 [compost metagenome]